MKNFLIVFCLLLSTCAFARTVHVRSTVTHRGQYRKAHVRTSPNHTQRDNYSAKGNVNPYTGKRGSKRVKK